MSRDDIRRERGEDIADTPGAVRQEGNLWKVRSESGRGAYTVRLSRDSFSCQCPDYGEWRHKCKHIYAVEITKSRSQRGIAPPKEVLCKFDIERVSGLLLEDSEISFDLQEATYEGRHGILLTEDEDCIPLTEFSSADDVYKGISIVLDEAEETQTPLFIYVSQLPYDYSTTSWPAEYIKRHRPIGYQAVIHILHKLGFVDSGFNDGRWFLVYDPLKVVDPFRHMPGGDTLREFIDQVEQAFGRLANCRGTAGHKARQELHKMRQAKEQLLVMLREAQKD